MKKGIVNLILCGVIFAVGGITLAPFGDGKTVSSLEEPYRLGKSEDGVSLTFNVYQGKDIVYGILDTLDKYNAKSTFYIGGCWADDNEECVREIEKRGHEIGNHGYFHKDHSKMSEDENLREISVCNDFLKLCVGVTPTLFAPPSGAYSEKQIAAANKLGMKTVLWSRDTVDWRDKDKNTVYVRATKEIKAGEIVLMHPYEWTLAALGDVLEYYNECSLRAITVSENLNLGG